ncbi:hypothetical protein [Flavobacterium humi]|uniref:Uncharacterized protein n=1 Tax=Flavobacterium humi TaxID=2562683 RepID=A0A4Z0L6N4_9FLAO|nr:hypothetical protein [Flavobacterium humi]TGD56766.1 hypothetical protein E4635_15100 [Flavobacterium humi]
MDSIADEKVLQVIKNIDAKIDKLNDQKIIAFFEYLGLNQREDIPKDYLTWETILIVVPDRHISHMVKQYKFLISRIAFTTNIYAQQIHIYDYKDWKNACRNKTQFQIKELLKTNFGGVKKINNDPE